MISPCGNKSAWVHNLEIGQKYDGWIDATDLDDIEFHVFVAGLQGKLKSPEIALGKCLMAMKGIKITERISNSAPTSGQSKTELTISDMGRSTK